MMRHSNLRTYITLLTLGPGVVCAILVGIYLTYALVRDVRNYTNEMSSVYAQQVARQAFQATRNNDINTLESTAQLALEYPLLRSISFYDVSNNEIAHAGPLLTHLPTNQNFFTQETNTFNTEDSQQLIVPILPSRLAGTANTRNIPTNNAPAGWVRLEFSQGFLLLHKYRTILVDICIVFFVLAAAFWFVTLFCDKLIDTLKKLAAGTRAISRGEHGTALPDSHILELQELSNATREMHASLTGEQENLQHHIEQSTQDLRETLETIEIQNIELELARREAVQASRVKSEFLANTSHEIRTPLNSIIGFSKLLLKTPLNIQQQDYLSNIRKSSEGLLTLINDVLDLSKIEAGKLVLDYTAFNIRETLEDVLQILAPGAHEKGLELLQMVYGDVPAYLLGDPLRLKQVLTNLIGNAIKFSEDGNIVVRIAADMLEQQRALLKVEVSDQGKGLPNNQQEIFTAFTQLDSASTRKHQGTGLGLAISQKIVRQMGGDIGYRSEPGNTTFWFTVNLDISNTQQETHHALLFKDHHILIYDKEKTSRLYSSHLLTNWGAQLTLTDNIEQIIPTVERHAGTEHPIHALLFEIPVRHCDNDLEKIIQVATQIQQRLPCPILFCYPTAARQQLTQSISSAILLPKPVTENRLCEALCHALQLKRTKTDFTEAKPIIPIDSPAVVLAVDDNPSNLKLLSTVLQDLGANVLQANDGAEAVDIYKTNDNIAVIFMDVQMPGMDGIEATKKIRYLETHNGRRTAIIALTAHALAEQRQNMMNVGMDGFLSKPASEQQLQDILEKWMGNDTKKTTPHTEPHKTETIIRNKSTIFVPPFHGDCVDRLTALQACGNRPDAACEMLASLLRTLATERDAITQALETKDMSTARELIHRLHGASSYCGTIYLKNCCNALETLLKKELYEYLPDAMAHMDVAVDQLLAWHKETNLAAFFSAS